MAKIFVQSETVGWDEVLRRPLSKFLCVVRFNVVECDGQIGTARIPRCILFVRTVSAEKAVAVLVLAAKEQSFADKAVHFAALKLRIFLAASSNSVDVPATSAVPNV